MPTPYETVAEFDTQVKAELARRALLDAGIRAVVEDTRATGLDWALIPSMNSIEVRVPISAHDRAIHVLEAAFGENGELLDELQDRIDG